MDAVELRQPDRVPTALHATFWLARYGGVSCRELMYDYDKTCDITRRALLDLDPDMFYPPHRVALGPLHSRRWATNSCIGPGMAWATTSPTSTSTAST